MGMATLSPIWPGASSILLLLTIPSACSIWNLLLCLASMKVYLDLSIVKKCYICNRVNVINLVDARRIEVNIGQHMRLVAS
jgi:hypothetical protein